MHGQRILLEQEEPWVVLLLSSSITSADASETSTINVDLGDYRVIFCSVQARGGVIAGGLPQFCIGKGLKRLQEHDLMMSNYTREAERK